MERLYYHTGALKEAEKSGYIAYHGEQKDMVPFFEMAHCIVHPSYYPEGMSNVLLEAAAQRLEVVFGGFEDVTVGPEGLRGAGFLGFLAALDHADIRVFGRKCLILGSGGASRTVRAALSDLGAETVVIVSRDPKAAKDAG